MTGSNEDSSHPGVEIPAMPPGVKLTTLPNGLTLILKEDDSAPVVSAQAWCQAGSIDEGNWLGAGISHLLEHMLFKGTKTRGGARIDQEVQEAGGYLNAYTSFDRTVFYINVPNTGASVAIDILCDIMQNATLPPEELEKEKKVILREMDMNQDDPSRRSSRRLFETAYIRSPCRFTVIGYPDVFSELKPTDVLDHYRRHYVPNNVFFVVVGDMNAKQVQEQIEAAYSKARVRPLPSIAYLDEPPQTAPRELQEEAPVEMGHVHVCWHIPGLRHPDIPALDVLATLLGNGRSSRLYQRLREKAGLVNQIDAWTYSPGNPGLFGISAVVERANFEKARASILLEVERLLREEIPAEELSKAVKQFISGTLAIKKTMQGQAQDLGSNWMAARDLNFSERYLAAVKKLSTSELQRVAKRYLTPEKRTVYALLPRSDPPTGSSPAVIRQEKPVQKKVLSNGLVVLLKEDHRLPFVEFRMVFGGGVHVESISNSGLTHLTARMLLQGTHHQSGEEMAGQIESLGGMLDTYSGNNSFGVHLELLKEDFGQGLHLLNQLLREAAFPSEALAREKRIQLASLQAQKDHLLQRAARNMRRKLFGQNGYGLDILGEEKALEGTGVAEVKSFYSRWMVPANATLAIYGDIEAAAVGEQLEMTFATWKSANPKFQIERSPYLAAAERRVVEELEKKQGVILIGFPAATIDHPARYPLELLQEACSDLGSRLFLRIREKLGLAYFVGAQNFPGLGAGYFAFYAGTEPEKLEIVETEMLEEVILLQKSGLTPEELRRAKAKVIGQKKIARQDLGGLAMAHALDELYGLGFDYSDKEDVLYERVTAEEIIAAANEFLRPESAVISIVRPG